MTKARTIIVGSTGLLLGLAVAGHPLGGPLNAADHLDAPTVRRDGRIDINDIYVFHPGGSTVDEQASQDLSRTVLIMTVNPAAGLISETSFRPDALYEFLVDATGDARADRVVRVTFTGDGVTQRFIVTLLDEADDDDGNVLAEGNVGSTVSGRSGVRVFAGVRDDPFFFDLAAFNAGGAFGMPRFGDDFFLGLDVSAIVVELPSETLGFDTMGVWGRTRVRTTAPRSSIFEPLNFVQIDRMGLPAVNTVFLGPSPFNPMPELKDTFNFTGPDQDATFRGEVEETLRLLHSLNDGAGDDPSDDEAKVQQLADLLIPDVLPVDLSANTGFPNGRHLADDVIDVELGLITEGAITSDFVDNDSDFLDEFPYLAPPNG